MDGKPKVHITLVMPRSLYERLNEIRWERRAASFTGLLRDMLNECADRHELEKEYEAESEMSHTGA